MTDLYIRPDGYGGFELSSDFDTQASRYIPFDEHQAILDRQARAARIGMDAAKAAGSHMHAEAQRLAAESNPDALESERAANAQLTAEVERLETQLLAGLRALGIACNSIHQCVSFEREVAGTVNVLIEQRDEADRERGRWRLTAERLRKQRDKAAEALSRNRDREVALMKLDAEMVRLMELIELAAVGGISVVRLVELAREEVGAARQRREPDLMRGEVHGGA